MTDHHGTYELLILVYKIVPGLRRCRKVGRFGGIKRIFPIYKLKKSGLGKVNFQKVCAGVCHIYALDSSLLKSWRFESPCKNVKNVESILVTNVCIKKP